MEPTWSPSRPAEKAWLTKWLAGPQRLRWSDLPVQVGDKVPDISLLDEDGRAVSLRQAWRDGPAILVFLRHFGCGCAWQRAERLAGELDALASAGATVIAIGQADPTRTRAFRERAGLHCPVLCDEGRQAYDALGLLDARPSQVAYGMPESFLRRNLAVTIEFLQSRQGSGKEPVDSPWQLPGEFVIDDSGTIILAHRSQYCADYADIDVLLSAITEARLRL